MMRAGTKRRVGLFLRWLILGVVIGAAWGAVAGFAFLGVGGLLYGALSGAISAILLAVIGGAEIFLPPTRLGTRSNGRRFLLPPRSSGSSTAR